MGYYVTPNPASDEKLLLPGPQDLATFRCCGFSIVNETVAPTVLRTGTTVHRTPKEYFYVSDRKRLREENATYQMQQTTKSATNTSSRGSASESYQTV